MRNQTWKLSAYLPLSGHLSLKDLLTKHGENGVFVILEDLLSNNEMTENVLAQVLNQNLK